MELHAFVKIPVVIYGYAADEYKAMTDLEVAEIVMEQDALEGVAISDWKVEKRSITEDLQR
jgi:hypothetical protein